MKTDLSKKIITGITICAITASGSSVIYAAGGKLPGGNNAPMSAPQNFRGGSPAMNFDALVAEGVIDQATADKMTGYMEQIRPPENIGREGAKSMTDGEKPSHFENSKPAEKQDMFTQMAEAGIITEAQANAIKAAMPQIAPSDKDFQGREMKMGTPMNYDNLVTEGIIDQETADKRTALHSEKEAERKAEAKKIQALTEEERKAHFDSSKDNKPSDISDEAVSSGIITEAQAAAIKAAIPQNPGAGFHGKGMGMNLTDLVAKDIIDQNTADKITEYQSKIETERRADMESIKPMTEEGYKAHFESSKEIQPVDPFTQMVDAGVITQAQADAIKAAMPR